MFILNHFRNVKNVNPRSMVTEDDIQPVSNTSALVEEKFRITGFKALFVFSILLMGEIICRSPNNLYIAIAFPIVCFLISVCALTKRKHSLLLGKVWVVFTVPLVSVLIIINGLAPAALLSLGAIFSTLLVNGIWRIGAAFMIAATVFLVPFSNVPYDPTVWTRLCISTITVTLVLLIILHHLEKALVESVENAAALKRALDGQRKANAAQSLFLATMSHEIRTPMNGMLGLLDAVLADDLSDKQRSHLEKVQRSSHLLQNILNGILDYSKLNAGKLVFEMASVNVGQLVCDMESFFQLQADNKDIYLKSVIDPSLAPAHLGDATRITQVLNNLLSNSIKFTQDGEVSLSLNVVKSTDYVQELMFCVRDSGIGITDEEKERIFSPFTQANQATNRNFGGTGLGLQIVKSLVEQMGGKVWVESQENVGSQFYVTLSLALTDELPINIIDNSKYLNKQFLGKVLVVEDNKINRLVAQEMLRPFVSDVSYANDGIEAVEAVEKESFDLVLMDLNMPNMDGFDATQAIRKNQQSLPIVALTAAVLADEVEKALASGMNGHLAKPIDKDKLFKILERYLKPAVSDRILHDQKA
ncbi:ATP-binding protein [Marinomonas sp. 2405UD68-3]|uniref:ATP-binding protein n=1 Tax=Marinomonas sp. 2405UD68-3 TaxID=3391835 RepID=UPI0039C995C5